jgi:hypothetical protein
MRKHLNRRDQAVDGVAAVLPFDPAITFEVGYHALKERAQDGCQPSRSGHQPAAFIELPRPSPIPRSDYLVELEDGRGATIFAVGGDATWSASGSRETPSNGGFRIGTPVARRGSGNENEAINQPGTAPKRILPTLKVS